MTISEFNSIDGPLVDSRRGRFVSAARSTARRRRIIGTFSRPRRRCRRSSRPRRATPAAHRGSMSSRLILVLLDLFAVIAGLAVAGVPWALLDYQGGRRQSILLPLRTELPYIVFYLMAFTAYGLYRRERRRLRHDWFVDAPQLFHACAAAALATLVASAALWRSALGWRPVHPFEATVVTCCVFVTVGAARALRAGLQARRGVARTSVAIIGSGAVARRVANSLGSFEDVRMVGFVDDPNEDGDFAGVDLLGGIADLDRILSAPVDRPGHRRRQRCPDPVGGRRPPHPSPRGAGQRRAPAV